MLLVLLLVVLHNRRDMMIDLKTALQSVQYNGGNPVDSFQKISGNQQQATTDQQNNQGQLASILGKILMSSVGAPVA